MMNVPLRLTAVQLSPDEVEEIRRMVEAGGRPVQVHRVDGPTPEVDAGWEEADVVVACHAPPGADAGRWLALLPTAGAPPVIVVGEELGGEEAAGLHRSGAFAVVPRGLPQSLGLAIRMATAWSRSSRSGGMDRSDPEPAERRRMAGLMRVIGQNLRDQLGSISNAVEVLSFQCGEGSLSQRRTIELLDRQCRRMTGLLDDYAEIARMDSDNPVPKREVAELGAALDRAIDRAQIEVVGRRVNFERSSRPDPLWIRIDARRLEQLVRHAIHYARRACPGCDAVRVGWRESADRIELVFEAIPRSQADVSSGVGAGHAVDLDLFLAASLAERLGGRVWPGLPFVVELPRSTASPPTPLPAGGEHHPIGGRPSGRHALLVDDNPESGQALALLIGRLGWHVRVTPDVAEAMEMIRTFRPEVVLIDLHMQVMDGLTLARRIRSATTVDAPLLIGISGMDDQPTADDSGGPAFDHFLHKPVRREEIAALLPAGGMAPPSA